jgi:hypothetical protein
MMPTENGFASHFELLSTLTKPPFLFQGPPSTGPMPDLGLFSGPASFAGTSRPGSAPSSVGPLSSTGFLDLDGLPGSGPPASTGPPPRSWDASAGVPPLSRGGQQAAPDKVSAAPGEVRVQLDGLGIDGG